MFLGPFDALHPSTVHAAVSGLERCTGPLFPWVIALYDSSGELLLKASQSGIYYRVEPLP